MCMWENIEFEEKNPEILKILNIPIYTSIQQRNPTSYLMSK